MPVLSTIPIQPMEADSPEAEESVPPSISTAASSLCPLCCEQELLTSSLVLSNCQHQSCTSCLIKWIQREEASGQVTPPICPFCRTSISDEDVQLILGRPFQPKETGGNPRRDDDEEEMDELTLQWLNEYTVPCGGCGSRIEKESGCDLIECLCGFRFCYSCGEVGGTCDCNPGHVFENDEEGLNDTDNFDANDLLRDKYGHVDLRLCILRREVQEERRVEREVNKYEMRCRWEYRGYFPYPTSLNVLAASNGMWLFASPTYFGSISMLKRALGIPLGVHSRNERDHKRVLRSRETTDRWEYPEINAGLCTINGRWLFSPKKNCGSVKMLKEQASYNKVSRTRRTRTYWDGESFEGPAPWRMEEKKRWCYSLTSVPVCTANGRWLLSSKWSDRCIKMLEQQLQADHVREERHWLRIDCSDSDSGIW